MGTQAAALFYQITVLSLVNIKFKIFLTKLAFQSHKSTKSSYNLARISVLKKINLCTKAI